MLYGVKVNVDAKANLSIHLLRRSQGNSFTHAMLQVPECRAEPDHVAYRAHGEMFRKLIRGVARIDLGLSAEDWEQHPIHNFLIMDVDEEIYIMGGRYGDRKPDCSVFFGLLPVRLNSWLLEQ